MKTTYIAIIGSRDFHNYNALERILDNYIADLGATKIVIVSGGAKGADTLGADYADYRCYSKIIHKANWKNITRPGARIKSNRYGKYDADAGHVRNSLIINDADIVVAFHNGSSGTADSLRKAKAAGKIIHEFKFK